VKARESPGDNFVSFKNNVLVLVYPKVERETHISFDLDSILNYYSDLDLCGPHKITAYQDIGHTQLVTTSTPTSMAINPTFLNLDTGVFKPIVNASYGNDLKIPYQIHFITETDQMEKIDNQGKVKNKIYSILTSIVF
jgi:hypothetical protein